VDEHRLIDGGSPAGGYQVMNPPWPYDLGVYPPVTYTGHATGTVSSSEMIVYSRF
jgi:hypothetical protein